jgi:hypothetical protein
MYHWIGGGIVATWLLVSGFPAGSSRAQDAPDDVPSSMTLWVAREYTAWDNALHSELSINGTLVNIFTSDTFEPVAEYLEPGWNTITVKTTAQEPANRNNELILRIGPARQDGKQMVMSPVLWEFRNGTDWRFQDGTYTHPLGPGVKEVTLTHRVYFAGMAHEQQELEAGDFVLAAKPTYPWNAPVTATVFVNDTPLNTFMLATRQIVVTSLLKEGRNEIRLVSSRTGSIRNNDIEFSVAGPAEWNVQRNGYTVTPIVQFKSMQGWTLDPKTGVLINKASPESETIERTIPFVLKGDPGGR